VTHCQFALNTGQHEHGTVERDQENPNLFRSYCVFCGIDLERRRGTRTIRNDDGWLESVAIWGLWTPRQYVIHEEPELL
jgi:hypothetical protein